MTKRAVILMPFIRSGFDTDVFHAILIRVKIKIFYHCVLDIKNILA